MTIKFNCNFEFEVSKNEIHEIGNVIRNLRNDRRDNERDSRTARGNQTIDVGKVHTSQRERKVDSESVASLEKRAKTARKIADLMKEIESLKKELNK